MSNAEWIITTKSRGKESIEESPPAHVFMHPLPYLKTRGSLPFVLSTSRRRRVRLLLTRESIDVRFNSVKYSEKVLFLSFIQRNMHRLAPDDLLRWIPRTLCVKRFLLFFFVFFFVFFFFFLLGGVFSAGVEEKGIICVCIGVGSGVTRR